MKVIWGLVIVIAVALWSVWPIFKHPSSIPDYGSDAVLLIWIINQPKSFDGNIFYPHKNTLAYSDRMLLSHFASRLPVLITGNPAVAFGFSLVMGQVLTLVIIYLFLIYLFKNPAAALIATSAFGLSQIRMEYQVHLQMWGMQYWLLGLLLLWRNHKPWQIYLGFILLGLQFWESPLPVYFALLVISVQCLVFRTKINKHHILGIVLAGLIILPMAQAYLSVSKEFGVVRNIREAAHNAISVNDLWGRFKSPALIVLLVLVLRQLNLKDKNIKTLGIVFISSLILAFGPVLKWHDQTIKIFHLPIPLPYAPAYYLVPGFNAFRTPSRWLLVTALTASGWIAHGLSKRKISSSVLLMSIGLIFLTGMTVTKVRDLPKPSEYPAVYQWLKNQPGNVVLEFPGYDWAHETKPTFRMLYSLWHGKKLVDGYSGFTPPLIIPPDIDYIISHLDEGGSATIEGNLVWQDETTRVFSRN